MDYIDFVRRLLRDIDEHAARLDAAMLSGVPTDWSGYREKVGERRGLMAARLLCVGALSGDDKRELSEFSR